MLIRRLTAACKDVVCHLSKFVIKNAASASPSMHCSFHMTIRQAACMIACEGSHLPNSVFPVPGGPVSSTPLGVFALSRAYLRASLRQATTSSSSSFAVSSPATSLKVTGGACSLFEAPFLALQGQIMEVVGIQNEPYSRRASPWASCC